VSEPSGVAADSAGALYIADTNNNRIRKVVNGTITTVAGNGSSGYSGDNGPATSARLNYPAGVAVDSAGNLYIADTGNNSIRKVSNGLIATVAGNGTAGFSGDNAAATSALLSDPESVAVDAAGNLYVADSANQRIRLLTPSTTPAISSGGIGPVYSSSPTIQPGEWASIYGVNLASGTFTWAGDFPTFLGGTSVTINGKAAYLWFVSPGQINLQAPDDTATGAVPVVVRTAAGSATSTVTLGPFAPSFLLLDASHVAGIILRTNGSGAYGGGAYDIIGPTGSSFGYFTLAAREGDTIELFGTGFGPTTPTVPAGQAFSGAASTINPVPLRINNVSVTPTFVGLVGAGLYQFNLTVPPGLGTGDVSLQGTVAGVQTPSGIVISLQ